MSVADTVPASRRYTRDRPCPICHGAQSDPRGQGRRCTGFVSDDGQYARCSRAEHAGGLPIEDGTEAYVHRVVGVCRCGARHGTEEAPTKKRPISTTTAEYDYFGPGGELVFRVLRRAGPNGKTFSQRRPDGQGGWVDNLQGVRRILYRLPELLEADRSHTVYVAEGEKCVEALRARDLVSTTNSGGTGGGNQWDDAEFREPLRGRTVVVLPDCDADGKGHRHAERIVRALEGVAASVRLVDLPGLRPAGEDVVDWLDRGGTADQLAELSRAPGLTASGFVRSSERLVGERERRLADARRILRFGNSFLDEALGGIEGRDLVLLGGARTGSGKTELATSIALTNCAAGKKVHYFALEAHEGELEGRIKYRVLADLYYANRNGDDTGPRPRYQDWVQGNLEELFSKYEDVASQRAANLTKNLYTSYRAGSYTGDDFEKQFKAIREETDLVILDHFHYVDSKDENENRAQRALVKQIRDCALRFERPVLVVAHVRKSDPRYTPLVPSEEAFHGSSDLAKIATKAIMIAPDYATKTGDRSLWTTYVAAVKNRTDGSVRRYVARMVFDAKVNGYRPEYRLGRLTNGDREFEPIAEWDKPDWSSAKQSDDMSSTPKEPS